MVPEVGIAPTSPRLQRGANLPQLLGDGVGTAMSPQNVFPEMSGDMAVPTPMIGRPGR